MKDAAVKQFRDFSAVFSLRATKGPFRGMQYKRRLYGDHYDCGLSRCDAVYSGRY
jgi:hypothetical protein